VTHSPAFDGLFSSTRRRLVTTGAIAAGSGLGLRSIAKAGSRRPVAALLSRQQAAIPVSPATAESIAQIGQSSLDDLGLRSVILRVVMDGEELVTAAFGESLPGVPATPEMHFRNGAVAISYLPDADKVTLRMLSNMTSGYPDYVYDTDFISRLYTDPLRQVTQSEQIETALKAPRLFAPGTNWEYSHTNCVLLGKAIEIMTGQPMTELMDRWILGPLKLTNTTGSSTPSIPAPILHAYSSERWPTLGIDPTIPFIEESTFWNPSWTLAQGTVQTTNIFDMTASAIAIGEGTLLSAESHAAQVAPSLIGFGAPLDGCTSCQTMSDRFSYGLGVVLAGPWVLQNPMFSGFAATEGYLASHKIAIAVSTTFQESSFDEQGNSIHGNASTVIFRAIADALVPELATPAATS